MTVAWRSHLKISSAVAALGLVAALGSAMAADIPPAPYTKAPAVMIPIYNWTGFYFGGNLGYGWGRSNDSSTLTDSTGAVVFSTQNASNLNGIVGGGQIGYNWQLDSRWVAGLEADFQGTGQKGNINFATGGVPYTLSQQIDWFGTVRGRVGFLAAPTVMVYGTGGLAYGDVKSSVTAGTFPTTSATNTNVGWTAGAGVEGALGGNWTAKLEYLYVDLGKATGSLTATPALTQNYSSHVTDNVVRVGINYRWGGPPVTKY